jgi:hypothetical protein
MGGIVIKQKDISPDKGRRRRKRMSEKLGGIYNQFYLLYIWYSSKPIQRFFRKGIASRHRSFAK